MLCAGAAGLGERLGGEVHAPSAQAIVTRLRNPMNRLGFSIGSSEEQRQVESQRDSLERADVARRWQWTDDAPLISC